MKRERFDVSLAIGTTRRDEQRTKLNKAGGYVSSEQQAKSSDMRPLPSARAIRREAYSYCPVAKHVANSKLHREASPRVTSDSQCVRVCVCVCVGAWVRVAATAKWSCLERIRLESVT